jgi:hypothetical protein
MIRAYQVWLNIPAVNVESYAPGFHQPASEEVRCG